MYMNMYKFRKCEIRMLAHKSLENKVKLCVKPATSYAHIKKYGLFFMENVQIGGKNGNSKGNI